MYTITADGCVFKECHTDRGIEATMSFGKEDYISLEFNGVKPVQHRKFRTDAEISKRKTLHDRELQKWEPEGGTESIGLEESGSGAWDQFRINEQKFGVKTTYDEHLYTTKVPNLSELTQEEIRKAELLAKELEGGKDDYNEEEDEEARYGAVLGSGRYKEFKSKKTAGNTKKLERRQDDPYAAFKSVDSKSSFRSTLKSKDKPPEYPKKEPANKPEANNNEVPPTPKPEQEEKPVRSDNPEAKPDQNSSGKLEAVKSPLKRERVISVNTDLKLGYKKVRQQLQHGKLASPIYSGIVALNPEVCTTPVDDELEKLYWDFVAKESKEKSREEEMKELKNFSNNIGVKIKSISRVLNM